VIKLLSTTFGLLFLFIFVQVQAKATKGYTQSIDPLIDSPGKTIGSDFNGDGIHDFIVGAPNNDDGGSSNAGAAYIFFGATTLSGTKDLGRGQSADVTILGKPGGADDVLGRDVSSAGDVNGDGIDDIMVGSTVNADCTAGACGAVYIFFGATTLSGTKNLGGADSADVTILGKGTGDNLSSSVSAAGDVNGDGFDDVIIGAEQNDDGGGNAGAAYIFFGASDLSGTKDLGGGASADVTVLGKGTNANERLGRSLSGAGDLNGDGFDDIVVGAGYNDDVAADAGAAYVIFGSSTLSGTKDLGGVQSADVTVLGKAATDLLGKQGISGAGDINGDGFDDIIIAAIGNDDGATYGGAVYIFFGASNLSGTKSLGGGESADVTVLGRAVGAFGEYLGTNVSGAGDINDDGFDDVILGAHYNSDVGTYQGSAYIFFGASNLSGTKNLGGGQSADVTVVGKTANDYFGFSVSGVGDVDGNGIPDVIIGARLNDDGIGNNGGAAYIIFGSSTLSGTKNLGGVQSADVTVLGKADGDNVGYDVGGGRSNPGP